MEKEEKETIGFMETLPAEAQKLQLSVISTWKTVHTTIGTLYMQLLPTMESLLSRLTKFL
jgi:hypothetical protein